MERGSFTPNLDWGFAPVLFYSTLLHFGNVLEHWGQAWPVVAQRSRSGRACALAKLRLPLQTLPL